MLTKVQVSFSSLPLPLPPLPACRGCGHERIRAISRAPGAARHAWTRTRERARQNVRWNARNNVRFYAVRIDAR